MINLSGFRIFRLSNNKDMTNISITQERVKFLFDYKDGFLYNKNKSSKMSTVKIGEIAGNIRQFRNCKRRVIKVDGVDYLAARLIFLWHEGYFPELVDHEDRNSLNDLISNLRAATKSQNQGNKTKKPGTSSAYIGVHKTRCNTWAAGIWQNNSRISLGTFKLEKDAALAYNKAAVKFHGEFANLNIIIP